MNTLETIKERRSIRKFKEDSIDNKLIEEILYYGTLAPSAHNKQPWLFVITKDKNKITAIADLMIESALKEEKVNGTILATANTMKEAPVLVLVFNKFNDYKLINNTLSIGACIENILLAATNYNIGSLWIRNTVIVEDEICQMFDKEDLSLASAISLGMANENPSQRPRIALKEILEWV